MEWILELDIKLTILSTATYILRNFEHNYSYSYLYVSSNIGYNASHNISQNSGFLYCCYFATFNN